MRILFPLQAFSPSRLGGPANTLYWHCCALTKAGFECSIITTTQGIIGDDITITDKWITSESGTVFYNQGFLSLKGIKQIFINISRHDIIHLNSLFYPLAILTFFYTKMFYPEKKIIWSVRGELSEEALKFSQYKKRLLLPLYKKFTASVLFHSTSDQETKEILSKFQRARVIQIPNLIKPAPRIDNLLYKKQLLFIGRIHPIKGIHYLLEAIALCKEFKLEGFILNIAGEFEERNRNYYVKLTQLIDSLKLADCVRFIGSRTGKDKESLYANSYATILPSESENFGLVVVESLNQGTPVIASKGTPWAILEMKNCGFHVENKPTELAKAISNIISLNKDRYLEMRRNGPHLVDTDFHIDFKIKQWFDVYEDSIK